MKADMIQTKVNKPAKPIGRFKTIQEAVKFKTDIVENLFAKVDRKVLENLGK
jgi:hypothetical protein